MPSQTLTSGTIKQRIWVALLLAGIALLAGYSLRLSLTRIYQVDECQNVYMAKALAVGNGTEFFTSASLYFFGPLSWLTEKAADSAVCYAYARLIFLAVFWLNLFLIAAAVRSGCFLSVPGLLSLLGAATLAPLWDYGFEIRHDNLILAGILAIWWAVRVRPMGMVSYVLAGSVGVLVLFIAVKAVVYIVPLWFLILVFPPAAHHTSRWRLVIAWAGAVIITAVLVRFIYGNNGLWEKYLSIFYWTSNYSTAQTKTAQFAPWGTLARLLTQTPLLLALFVAVLVALAFEFRRFRKALTWEGSLPEVLLVGLAFAVLFINPTPFPYNLVNVVPFLYICVCRYLAANWAFLWSGPALRPLVVGVLLFTHLVPFAVATQRHSTRSNSRQQSLMRLAESLTDPAKDPVYDGIGMVPTRRSIHFQWYLHSLNIHEFGKGSVPWVRDMLAARPAAAFIPSYRTDWLPELDHEFIRAHYVPLADDFWVLGKLLPPGGGTFEIIHPGRYRIAALDDAGLSETHIAEICADTTAPSRAPNELSGTVDSIPISNQPMYLEKGLHRLETSPKLRPAVVWVGPNLDRTPKLDPSSHRSLFVNWY